MYKIYTINNYFFLLFVNTNVIYDGYKEDFQFQNPRANQFDVIYKGSKIIDGAIFSNFLDSTDTEFTSNETLIDFYSLNTGFNTTSGGSEVVRSAQRKLFSANSLAENKSWCPANIGSGFPLRLMSAYTLYVTPFILEVSLSVKYISFEITSFGALSTIYTGIYELDSSHNVIGLVSAFAPIPGTSNGVKTISTSFALDADKWYGLAIFADVSLVLRNVNAYPLFGSYVASALELSSMYVEVPLATELPANPIMTDTTWINAPLFLAKN